MTKKLVLGCKIAAALVALAAVAVQFAHGMQSPTFNRINFYSFFTIESNIFGAVILLLSAMASGKKLDYWRGAATLYMAMTGVIYALLLSGADVQTPIPWVNAVLHYIFPIVLLLDWLVDRPHRHMPFRIAVMWLIFPIMYVGYSLVRGHFVGWYPYPFLNVTQYGYAQVLATSLVLAGFVILLALFIANLPRVALRSKAKNG